MVYTQEINGQLQIFKIDINSGVRTQLTHGGIFFQANAGADWFDPAYALAGFPATRFANHDMGRSEKGEIGMRVVLIFSLILLVLMCGGVCRVFAEAPTTPKILFTSLRDGNREVYMMNPDGSEQVNLTQHRATDLLAVWSPTGEQILFVSDRQGTRARDLYLMDPDGSNIRRVFKKKAKGWRSDPTWSPDGKHFAYSYTDWDRFEFGLYLGTFGEEDVDPIGNGGSPVWSPDGSEIAYHISPHPQTSLLTFINVRTRETEQPLLTKALRWQFQPSWSALGDRLAFAGNKHPLPVILDKDLHNAWKDKQTSLHRQP